MRDFNSQNLANTAWAFATLGHKDEWLFAALAAAAERRLRDFNSQELANTAWAFATLDHKDERLLAVLAAASERRISNFGLQCAMVEPNSGTATAQQMSSPVIKRYR